MDAGLAALSTASEDPVPPRFLTKYELARLVSARVGELESNAPVMIPTFPTDTLFDIAAREVDRRTLDMELKRFLPEGKTETLHLTDFPMDD
jgi:DNA-directed RNA polymerase subunit K/omega